MLSYQHEYHAGNHADVLKHAVLALLIEALQRKPKPIRVIDTHAGSGTYDLTSDAARRAAEHASGIARVLEAGPAPPELARYAGVVETLNADRREGGLRRYPGSPSIARAMLRDEDHLELFELHPRAHAALEAELAGDRNVHIHRRDGFEGLLGVVPPPERRGIVLIDPSYETREDFRRVLDAVPAAQRRWANAVLAVWYPLLRRPEAAAFVRQLRALEVPRLFQAEVLVAPSGGLGLRGSGVVVANLPYGLDQQLKTLVPWLHARLAPDGAGGWQARWLATPA